jgi:hypothetical protein
MGRIYEQRGGPESMRWFRSPDRHLRQARTDGHAGNARRGQSASAWRQWLAWAKLQEMP